jgi:hypothetical protein
MNKERIRYDTCPPLMLWAALRRCGRPFFLNPHSPDDEGFCCTISPFMA